MNRPLVAANFAISVDGRIATRGGAVGGFGSAQDKRRLLLIRSRYDAVLVGARTLAADAMALGLPDARLRAARRRRGQAEYPLRVVVSNSGAISARARLFTADVPNVPVVFSTRRLAAKKWGELAGVCDLHLHLADEVKLATALETLREDYGVKSLLCEGGGRLFRALLAAGLVDELYLTLTPLFFGGAKAPTLTGAASPFLPKSTRLALARLERVGGECFTRWRVLR